MTGRSTSGARSFLFLQGLATPFLFRLARQLEAEGHATAKIHICGADLVFWPGAAILFRGHRADWPLFLAGHISRLGVTDLVLFGDCRPYHEAAIDIARRSGIAVHVFEEGYVRPGFITLEREGTNGHSLLPRRAETIRALGAALPLPASSVPFFTSFLKRATWDVTAQTAGVLLTPLFPHYRWHGPTHPFVEYAGWIRRFTLAPFRRRTNRDVVDRLMEGPAPFFLMPLQLDSDYQIRIHSPYRGVLDAAADVIASFAREAPADALLVLKLHPLDPGLIPYARRIAALGRRHGVAERLRVIGEADLPALVDRSAGIVLVNSTTGILALRLGRKLKALGTAIYDLPGLTFQGPLDAFWHADDGPDPLTTESFMKLLVARTQVEGDYFTWPGIEVGVRAAAARILSSPRASFVDDPSAPAAVHPDRV